METKNKFFLNGLSLWDAIGLGPDPMFNERINKFFISKNKKREKTLGCHSQESEGVVMKKMDGKIARESALWIPPGKEWIG